MNSKKLVFFLAMFSCIPMQVINANVLLEFKGAGFLATGSRFKKIYGRGSALYGPELTFQVCQSNWYGFVSVDYLHKKGHSIGLHTPTTIRMVPLGIGLKYFMPTCWECADLYLGLGFQPVHVSLKNNPPFVPDEHRWAFGGIAKVGSYVYFSCNFFLDLFIDYSFAHLSKHTFQTPPLVPLSASVSGAIFGVGLGYKF